MASLILKSYTYKYPHPAVTTDCVILTFHEGKLKVLLIRRGIEPFKGEWALPGGFLRMDESAEECAHRELKEETGVTGCPIKQFHTYSKPGRDPRERVITIAFYALIKWQEAKGADDAEYAGWIPMDNVPNLAFDHDEILKGAMEAIRRDIYFEPVGFDLLDDRFSMTQLQTVYEAILGKEFDRRNFAKKMKHLGLLEAAGEHIPEPIPVIEESPSMDKCFMNDMDIAIMECKEVNLTEPDRHDSNESIFSIIDSVNKPKMRKPRGRHSSLFRLNRNRYNKLKEDDTIEF